MLSRLAGVCLVFVSVLSALLGNSSQFYPGAVYDPKIPTLLQVAGHDWAEDLTDHGQLERYLQALEKAAPARVRVVKYGETWEGRALYYLVIGSERNLARLDAVKAGVRSLAYPQTVTRPAAEELIHTLPAIVWLAYSVHGNETSGTEAGLLTAYHLLAASGDPLADRAAADALVIIDPIQNPDGRARFLNYYRQTRGRWPDENRWAAEHMEDWPGGRSNHYLFDMNRDWFALTQPETRARVKAFLEWFPQVLVDLHEMGSESSYYFAPPAPPINPQMSRSQSDWHVVFGKNNAAWFDKMGFDYFTREIFDSFYPGYGEGWPMFQGAIGMTYEQAGVRGLVIKREDEEVLTFRDAVQHHFIASLSTVETAAKNREPLLRHFYEVRKAGLQENKKEDSKAAKKFEVRGFMLDPAGDKVRAAKLARILMMQGIEVHRATKELSLEAQDYDTSEVKSRHFPAGAYYVPLAQPARPLVSTLLARETPMDDQFLKEQERRYQKRLRDQFYDVTAWSLPLLYDVPCYTVDQIPSGGLAPLRELPSVEGQVQGSKARLAYLIPWGTNAAVHALSRALSKGIRVHSSDKPFTQRGRNFPAGSLILKVKGNPEDLHEQLVQIARDTSAEIFATDTGWVDEGVNFGSGEVRFVKKPKVALAYNLPTANTSVGALRFLIEQVYDYPVTIIPTRLIGLVDLRDFDVLILPDASSSRSGGYQGALGEGGVQKLKQWVSSGGTLIAIGEATRWLTEEKVALLATSREYRNGADAESKPPAAGAKSEAQPDPKPKPDKAGADSAEKKPFDLEKAILPEKELPGRIPGALMRVRLDPEHWLAFGYHSETCVMVSSRNIFTPLKLDKGRNVGLYTPADKLMMSGFSWKDTRDQLAEKAYLMNQPLGSGHVVAFAEDPGYRAFCDGLNILLFNAIFLAPAH